MRITLNFSGAKVYRFYEKTKPSPKQNAIEYQPVE